MLAMTVTWTMLSQFLTVFFTYIRSFPPWGAYPTEDARYTHRIATIHFVQKTIFCTEGIVKKVFVRKYRKFYLFI